MTNVEKFLKDGISAREFREKLAQFIFDELGFYEGTEEAIDEVIGDFLYMIEKPTLTEDERVILRNLNDKFNKIGRTDGVIQIRRTIGELTDWHCFCAYNHLFKFIKERRRILNRRIVRR